MDVFNNIALPLLYYGSRAKMQTTSPNHDFIAQAHRSSTTVHSSSSQPTSASPISHKNLPKLSYSWRLLKVQCKQINRKERTTEGICSLPNTIKLKDMGAGMDYFAGGFLMKSTPFSILPLRPFVAASRSFFSLSLVSLRGL